jgi:hypothetical protein
MIKQRLFILVREYSLTSKDLKPENVLMCVDDINQTLDNIMSERSTSPQKGDRSISPKKKIAVEDGGLKVAGARTSSASPSLSPMVSGSKDAPVTPAQMTRNQKKKQKYKAKKKALKNEGKDAAISSVSPEPSTAGTITTPALGRGLSDISIVDEESKEKDKMNHEGEGIPLII